MRQPTPLHAQFAWWRAALAGHRPPIHEGHPQPGFYQRRLVKGGPWVPVRIWLDQPIEQATGELNGDEFYRCEVDGKSADATDQWGYCATSPITEADYQHMRARTRWATAHAEDHPIANPRQPVDWASARVPF